EGRVTRGGAPVAGLSVTASGALLVHNASFVVKTGDDGGYKFDRLSPDRYFIAPTGGPLPLPRVTPSGRTVPVAAGETARADLELPAQTVTLTVTITQPGGQPVQTAELHVVAGAVRATVAREVHAAEAAMTDGFFSFNIALGGRPA